MQTQTHRADACTPALLQAAIAAAEAMAEQAKNLAEAILHAPLPQGIVLPPMGRAECFRELTAYRGAWRLNVTDAAGNETSMVKEYERPADRTVARFWHPAHWAVSVTRRDERGNIWRSYLGEFVMDDFGDLVEVLA